MELYAQKEQLNLEDVFWDQDIPIEGPKCNQRLSDQILFWMMELFLTLISIPFEVALELSKKSRAAQKLRAVMDSDAEHELVQEIEEKVENDEEHYRIPKKEFGDFLKKKTDARINAVIKKRERKNSLRGAATSPRNKEKRGVNSGKNKQPGATRNQAEKEQTKSTSTTPNPYLKQKKKEAVKKGKHNFRRGGKKKHQQENKNKNKSNTKTNRKRKGQDQGHGNKEKKRKNAGRR